VLFGARGRNRRNLASAFVGEIAAAIETVEENAEIRRLQLSDASDGKRLPDFSDFQLPKLTVYETNIGQVSLFEAPLPRELTYFYTRLMALPVRLRALRPEDSSSAEDIKRRTHEAVEEIAQTMSLGENLLRSFRGFISRKQPSSISRA
jgi:hypothetical protein